MCHSQDGRDLTGLLQIGFQPRALRIADLPAPSAVRLDADRVKHDEVPTLGTGVGTAKMSGPSGNRDLDQGHGTQAWLAVSDEPTTQVAGQYFYHLQQKKPAAAIRNTVLQGQSPCRVCGLSEITFSKDLICTIEPLWWPNDPMMLSGVLRPRRPERLCVLPF